MWPRFVWNTGASCSGPQQSAGFVITLRNNGFIMKFFEKPADLRKQTEAILKNLRRKI
jgi:hypothetical protein